MSDRPTPEPSWYSGMWRIGFTSTRPEPYVRFTGRLDDDLRLLSWGIRLARQTGATVPVLQPGQPGNRRR